MKNKLKQLLMSNNTLWFVYKTLRLYLRHLSMLRFYFYDIYTTYQYMHWPFKEHSKIESFKAELLLQFHKLEKGIVMPGKRRVFGEETVIRIIELLNLWQQQNNNLTDPVFLSSVQALKDYKTKIIEDGFIEKSKVIKKINDYLQGLNIDNTSIFTTPEPLCNEYKEGLSSFQDLVSFRRSVREFDDKYVEISFIKKAVEIAQKSPSVCNRQASKIYYIRGRNEIDFLLSQQNGNAGFGYQIPSLAIVSVDQTHFFNSTERNQPYIDGGLFTMSFLYGLSAQGLSSCCLNWCVVPSVDRKTHKVLKIPKSERIMMLVAIGYPAKGVKVPKSARKNLDNVLVYKK